MLASAAIVVLDATRKGPSDIVFFGSMPTANAEEAHGQIEIGHNYIMPKGDMGRSKAAITT